MLTPAKQQVQFDPLGYEYANHRGGFLKIERALGTEALEDIRGRFGGKGVSLEVSKQIARIQPKLELAATFLPPAVSDGEQISYFNSVIFPDNRKRPIIFIMRSSELTEDWIDSRCGVQQSGVFCNRNR